MHDVNPDDTIPPNPSGITVMMIIGAIFLILFAMVCGAFVAIAALLSGRDLSDHVSKKTTSTQVLIYNEQPLFDQI